MFGWLRKRTRNLEPEARWLVTVDETELGVTDGDGRVSIVAKADLSRVAIETNDTGPWGADFWWVLFGTRDQPACSFPQGATGESAAVDYLTSLPAFKHDEMIKAMRSTSNAVFPVWKRPA